MTDPDGGVAETGHTVHVYGTNAPPFVTFTGYPTAFGSQALQVAFSAQTFDDGGPVTLAWDFNDDGTFGDDLGPGGTPTSPTHTYAKPGTKIVRVKATDSDGATTIDTETVQVTASTPPVPAAPRRT